MLKNTFTAFPVSSQVFWCLEHTTNLTVKRRSWSIFRIMQMSLTRAQLSKHMDLCCFEEVGGWKLKIYPRVWGNPWPHWCINYALICFYGPINACILRILSYEVVNFWYANWGGREGSPLITLVWKIFQLKFSYFVCELTKIHLVTWATLLQSLLAGQNLWILHFRSLSIGVVWPKIIFDLWRRKKRELKNN